MWNEVLVCSEIELRWNLYKSSLVWMIANTIMNVLISSHHQCYNTEVKISVELVNCIFFLNCFMKFEWQFLPDNIYIYIIMSISEIVGEKYVYIFHVWLRHLNKFAQSRISTSEQNCCSNGLNHCKGCMRSSEATKKAKANAAVTLMPFPFQRCVNNY